MSAFPLSGTFLDFYFPAHATALKIWSGGREVGRTYTVGASAGPRAVGAGGWHLTKCASYLAGSWAVNKAPPEVTWPRPPPVPRRRLLVSRYGIIMHQGRQAKEALAFAAPPGGVPGGRSAASLPNASHYGIWQTGRIGFAYICVWSFWP